MARFAWIAFFLVAAAWLLGFSHLGAPLKQLLLVGALILTILNLPKRRSAAHDSERHPGMVRIDEKRSRE